MPVIIPENILKNLIKPVPIKVVYVQVHNTNSDKDNMFRIRFTLHENMDGGTLNQIY